MNDIDKRLEGKVERILNFDMNSSTKLSQSSMSHEEHSHLMLEVFEEDIPELISALKAEREEKERLKERIEKMKPEWVKNNSLALKQLQQYEKALKEIIEYYPEGNHVREIAKSALGGDRE